MKILSRWLILLLSLNLLLAEDPGTSEDKEAERLKLLKAADQLDNLTSHIEALQVQTDQQKADIQSLKTQLAQATADAATIKEDITTLKSAIEKLDAARDQEREVLLKKVSEIIADALKTRPVSPPPPVEPSEVPAKTPPSTAVPPAIAGRPPGM